MPSLFPGSTKRQNQLLHPPITEIVRGRQGREGARDGVERFASREVEADDVTLRSLILQRTDNAQRGETKHRKKCSSARYILTGDR
jgi:hypothetical protein